MFRNFRKRNASQSAVAILALFTFIFSLITPLQPSFAATDGNNLSASEMAVKATNFINAQYQAGEKIDGFTADVLNRAGENLAVTKWVYQDESVKSGLTKQADLLIADNQSQTKALALSLMAVNAWQDSDRQDHLAQLLIDRQKTTDSGKGSFENSIYSDMWVYLALEEAGKINDLDTATAKDYILSKQGKDGSWGETFGDVYYSDFLSTTQAIRALNGLPNAATDTVIQQAIAQGLAYCKTLQQTDGGIYGSPWDDPAVDNSEMVVTLKSLKQDPAGQEWQNAAGLTPLDYLRQKTMNTDGSFGSSKNIFGAAEALSAYLLVSGQGETANQSSTTTSNTTTATEQETVTADMVVVGMNGDLLYNPGMVAVNKNDQWGLTVMGALQATGLSYTDKNGFVTSIDGQSNTGMKGWMYQVNGSTPGVAASEKPLKAGDRVIWWYSNDLNTPAPSWNSLKQGTVPVVNPDTLPTEVPTEPEVPTEIDQVDPLSDANIDKQEQKSFADVNSSSYGWAQESIETLARAGIVAGVDKDHFQPEKAMTRGQLAAILVRALSLSAATTDVSFKDIKGTEWYGASVAAAAQAGLVKGYADGTFQPNKTVSREELAAILVRVMNIDVSATIKLSFTDAPKTSAWAQSSVATVAEAGLMKGYPNGTFQPRNDITRAECAAIICRVLAERNQ